MTKLTGTQNMRTKISFLSSFFFFLLIIAHTHVPRIVVIIITVTLDFYFICLLTLE